MPFAIYAGHRDRRRSRSSARAACWASSSACSSAASLYLGITVLMVKFGWNPPAWGAARANAAAAPPSRPPPPSRRRRVTDARTHAAPQARRHQPHQRGQPPRQAQPVAGRPAARRRAMAVVIAIDAGTTGVRSRSPSTSRGSVAASPYREFTQHFPQPGWVEHDADEIWQAVAGDARPSSCRDARRRRSPPSASPTSARPWWPGTAAPASRCHRAIVWQDRRTADRCDELAAAGHLAARARSAPGSCSIRTSRAPRWRGCSPRAACAAGADLALGTIDTWLLWNLTGGAACTPPTRPTPAARCCSTSASAGVGRRAGRPARRAARRAARGAPVERPLRRRPSTAVGAPAGIPVSGIAGDQQARAVRPGLLHAGHDQEHLRHRLASCS